MSSTVQHTSVAKKAYSEIMNTQLTFDADAMKETFDKILKTLPDSVMQHLSDEENQEITNVKYLVGFLDTELRKEHGVYYESAIVYRLSVQIKTYCIDKLTDRAVACLSKRIRKSVDSIKQDKSDSTKYLLSVIKLGLFQNDLDTRFKNFVSKLSAHFFQRGILYLTALDQSDLQRMGDFEINTRRVLLFIKTYEELRTIMRSEMIPEKKINCIQVKIWEDVARIQDHATNPLCVWGDIAPDIITIASDFELDDESVSIPTTSGAAAGQSIAGYVCNVGASMAKTVSGWASSVSTAVLNATTRVVDESAELEEMVFVLAQKDSHIESLHGPERESAIRKFKGALWRERERALKLPNHMSYVEQIDVWMVKYS